MILDSDFPLGIASGEAFIGRHQEIKRLGINIQRRVHTLLLSPRRYGKTSLVRKVLSIESYPWIEIDFFIAQNEFSIEQKFLKGVQTLISQIDTAEHWMNGLINYFKNANKTWTVGIRGVQLELIPENHKDIPENILEALNALEYVLNKKKKLAVIFLDEFQEMANVPNSLAIEGAIRHFAQSSRQVVFVFSGSSRHMLKHLFSDKTRPLFALCDEINLERIPAEEYRTYINKVARKTWKKNLSEDAFDQIMQLTECHPKYVYNLCMRVWEHYAEMNRIPTGEDIKEIWEKLLNEKLKDLREILAKRSAGQIKILSYIALGNISELTGQLAQSKLGMSSSAIVQSLQILDRDDYVEKLTDNSYQIIDPLLKATLMQYGSDFFL